MHITRNHIAAGFGARLAFSLAAPSIANDDQGTSQGLYRNIDRRFPHTRRAPQVQNRPRSSVPPPNGPPTSGSVRTHRRPAKPIAPARALSTHISAGRRNLEYPAPRGNHVTGASPRSRPMEADRRHRTSDGSGPRGSARAIPCKAHRPSRRAKRSIGLGLRRPETAARKRT